MKLGNSEKLIDGLKRYAPPTLKLQAFGLAKIPLIFAVRPRVLESSGETLRVLVPLNYVTKNHLGSMYFGALSIGADTVVGIMALQIIDEYPDLKMAPIFKDMQANFLKRAETNVVFECSAADQIRAMIEKSKQSGERVTEPIAVKAVSEKDASDVFAEFTLGLSLKAVAKANNK